MRILFLTQVLPYPLDAGPKQRAYYVLQHLARSHAVTLLSWIRPADTAEAIAHLKQMCQAVYTLHMVRSLSRDVWHLARSLVSGSPFLIVRDWSAAMLNLMQDLLAAQPYDAIHADQLPMAQYALCARSQISHLSPRLPSLILDQHNASYMIPARMAEMESNWLKRIFLHFESHKLALYEMQVCRQFDRVVWVTRQDFEAVQKQAPYSRPVPCSAVIPICIDPQKTSRVVRKADARRVTFLGGLHYPPNAQGVLWFVEQVWPRVQQQVPDAVLTIIGKNPPARVRNTKHGTRNLDITGYVADPTPYLEETAVFIVPLLAGGGMRVKIVDAWAWGLPVISTTVGAEGIAIRPGENILIADTPDHFARATVRLLREPDVGRRMAEAGRRWVEAHYDWRQVYRMWDQVYAGLGRE